MPFTYLPIKDVSGFYLAPVPLEFPGKSGASFIEYPPAASESTLLASFKPVPIESDCGAGANHLGKQPRSRLECNRWPPMQDAGRPRQRRAANRPKCSDSRIWCMPWRGGGGGGGAALWGG